VALSDLAVFSEYAYDSMTEVLAQQVALFNAASRGTITLQPAAHQGDYSDRAFYAKIDGLVRRRNAYGSGSVTGKTLSHLVDTMVKVAAGTPPVNLDPGQFKWIQRNPEEAGAALGQQLAVDTLADMLNTGVAATYAALAQVTEVVHDGTAGSLTPTALNNGARKFGDRSNAILAWILHSSPLHDFYNDNLANAERLFTYGTVNVIADPFGRVFVTTDSPSLVTVDGVSAGVDEYHTLGLVADALVINQNNDFTDNFETKNGDENIARTYQAEWSYNVGVKGFAWDKTNGGKSPNDAALATSTNWDKYATSNKDIAGVVVETR
tara:strand:- start:22563 stop:23531 length:969 start_codon:yes stop_codon:yes gene_type:complete